MGYQMQFVRHIIYKSIANLKEFYYPLKLK